MSNVDIFFVLFLLPFIFNQGGRFFSFYLCLMIMIKTDTHQ